LSEVNIGCNPNIKNYYPSHIKEEHYRRYALAKKKYEEATEEECESQGMEVPVRVAMMTHQENQKNT